MGGKGSGRKPLAPCGTTAAYKRHRKRGENCDICKQANRDYYRKRNGYKGDRIKGRTVLERQRLHRNQQSALVKQWKLDAGQCAQCGLVINERTVVCIDCDHIDPQTKAFTISAKIGRYADDKLIEELRKCQAICRNCHALRTHDEQHHLGRRTTEHEQHSLFEVQHGANR